jgi:hypothetical protein
MSASRYDIYAEQGVSFKLHLQYSDTGNNPVNFAGYTGAMQVRESETDKNIYLFLSHRGITGGGITGEFDLSAGEGIAGIGGISFNTGVTGTPGVTGGIFLSIDKDTMSYLPAKKYLYDLKLTSPNNETARIIEGIFEVYRQITR